METVIGVTATADEARRMARVLEAALPAARVGCLVPGQAAAAVPTTDAEPPGVARPLGAVVGAAAGGAAGFAVAGLVFPGVGPVLALGALALGLGGAAAGAAAGARLDDVLDNGLPRDELYVYRDALRRGHGLVLVMADSDAEAGRARGVLEREGAESVDAARERWWLGLRDAEEEHYTPHGDFAHDETRYRLGFEAGLRDASGSPLDAEGLARLRERHGAAAAEPAFRVGYARGAAYARASEGRSASRHAEDRAAGGPPAAA
jgi:hypothetical protein